MGCLRDGQVVLRQMDVHLVPVEVRVVGRAYTLVESQSVGRLYSDLMGHDRLSMQTGLSIE